MGGPVQREGDPRIRRLAEEDIEALVAIRRESLLAEPTAFSNSPATDLALNPEHLRAGMRRPAVQASFGAFDPDLAGAVVVHRSLKEKEAHRAGISGLYVRPEHRWRGLGTALLAAAVGFARSLPGVTHLHLGVSATSGSALRLYERAGFVTWGIEPEAFEVDGVFIATHHMVLRLDSPAA